MWYQRIVEIDTPREEARTAASKIQLGKRRREAPPVSSRKKFKQPVVEGAIPNEVTEDEDEDGNEDEDEDEMHQFRRVHVIHKNLISRFPMASKSRK
jgi:hypothetical protein